MVKAARAVPGVARSLVAAGALCDFSRVRSTLAGPLVAARVLRLFPRRSILAGTNANSSCVSAKRDLQLLLLAG